MQPQVRGSLLRVLSHSSFLPFLILLNIKLTISLKPKLPSFCWIFPASFDWPFCLEGPALEVVEEIKKSGGDAVAVKADCK
jgi:hypothetical protein